MRSLIDEFNVEGSGTTNSVWYVYCCAQWWQSTFERASSTHSQQHTYTTFGIWTERGNDDYYDDDSSLYQSENPSIQEIVLESKIYVCVCVLVWMCYVCFFYIFEPTISRR